MRMRTRKSARPENLESISDKAMTLIEEVDQCRRLAVAVAKRESLKRDLARLEIREILTRFPGEVRSLVEFEDLSMLLEESSEKVVKQKRKKVV